MRKTKIFTINGIDMQLPIYQKGDRVVTKIERDGIVAHGTVQNVSQNGLFVDVQWDQTEYHTESSIGSGTITLGTRRIVDGISFEERTTDNEPTSH